jgi:N-acetylglutamate synthase-like GNAT family acetyltransferase
LQIQIRIAKTGDVSSIETLLAESFAEFKSLYTKDAFEATAIKSDEILVRMNEGPLWVALKDAKIIGTVAAVFKNGSLYIRGMAVHPSARGHKIGENLLVEIEKYALTQNCKRLFLGTTQYLKSAIRLYERMGFRRLEGFENFYGMPLMIMEKLL